MLFIIEKFFTDLVEDPEFAMRLCYYATNAYEVHVIGSTTKLAKLLAEQFPAYEAYVNAGLQGIVLTAMLIGVYAFIMNLPTILYYVILAPLLLPLYPFAYFIRYIFPSRGKKDKKRKSRHHMYFPRREELIKMQG